MNLPNTETSPSTEEESGAPTNVHGDQNDAHPKTDENGTWGSSMDMRRNVVFVPVPVHFGMYSGLFNGNFSMMPFALPRQDIMNKN